jgi:hypothetical protein
VTTELLAANMDKIFQLARQGIGVAAFMSDIDDKSSPGDRN